VHDAVFFSNAAAYSKTADILTSSAVRLIAEAYLGKNIRLKCHRSTHVALLQVSWHTDNKVDSDRFP
jgi:hypothetical protein